MLKVLKSFGNKNKKDNDEKNKDKKNDLSTKTFGSLGRDKLKQDILKHQGMISAPSLTPAGLALKKQQEKNNPNYNENEDIDKNHSSISSYIGAMDLTSHSIDATPSQLEHMHVSPNFDDDDIVENPHINPSKDGLNNPSISANAEAIFQLDTEIELPSVDEQNSTLDFPAYISLSDKDFSLPEKKEAPLPLNNINNNSDTIEFSFSSPEPSINLDNLNNSVDISPSLPLDSFDISNNSSLSLNNQETSSLSFELEPSLDLNNISVDNSKQETVLSFNPNSLNKPLEGQDLDFAQQLATAYSEQNTDFVIESLKTHISSHEGLVAPRFWYMLMDCYQTNNNREDFEKSAISFAHIFNASPPSWFDSEENSKKTVMSGKNILILEPQFKLQQTEKFKPFLKSAKEEKFCRINVSPCKFEMSEAPAIVKLLELFRSLRKAKVLSVLMGDNNLISFCKNYINPDFNNKMLKDEFLQNETTFWLLYLEILQWKGLKEDFETLALDFAIKFEISPPDWEDSGIMRLDKNTKNELLEEDLDSLDKVINSNNVQDLLGSISKQFESNKKAELNFASVESLDFAAAGSISYKIQELWSMPEHKYKKVIFKYPNEMIVTLLEMVGVSEFVDIIQRKR